MLLIVDEVQSGMGRTGKMFAIEHTGVTPDVVTMAKGIASGLPLGVMTSRSEIVSWPPGTHASTFGGNPVSCAASLATLKLLRDSLVKNAEVVGAHMLAGVKALMDKHSDHRRRSRPRADDRRRARSRSTDQGARHHRTRSHRPRMLQARPAGARRRVRTRFGSRRRSSSRRRRPTRRSRSWTKRSER